MTHSKCGVLLLLAAAGLVACGGDSTDPFRETDQTIVASPASLFLQQGASVFVIVERRDAQGNQLAGDFEATDVGAGITVEKDTSFLQTTLPDTAHLETRARFIVTATGAGSTQFTVTSGGVNTVIPVRVIPTDVPATFSNASLGLNEPVTITLPADFKFTADAVVESNLGAGLIQSFSADSTAITALIIPGSSGPLLLSGLSASFLPGVPLDSLPTVESVTAEAFQGIGDPNTAPTIAAPGAIGESTNLFGGGVWSGVDITGDGGTGAQYYKFEVVTAGDYHFVTNWPNDADVDQIVCFDAACNGGAFAGSGTSQPEDGVLPLTPGTYYLAIVLFAGTGPTSFTTTISLDPPAAP